MKTENAFALPLVLITSVVISLLVTKLFVVFIREKERFQLELRRTRFENEVSEKQKKYLLSLAGNGMWSLPPALWSIEHSEPENRFLHLIVLKKNARPGKGPLPNWKYLTLVAHEQVCEDSVPGKNTQPLTNNETCKQLGTIDDETILVRANISLDKLHLNTASSKQPRTIAVEGGIEISQLSIEKDAPLTTIIALGNIDIKEIVGATGAQSSLLLVSVLGKARVENLLNVQLCDTTPSGPTTQLRIEAPQDIELRQVTLKKSILGCPIARSSLIWPEVQILGSPP